MNKSNLFLMAEDNPKNPGFNFKNLVMEKVENTDLFNSYIKSENFKFRIQMKLKRDWLPNSIFQ